MFKLLSSYSQHNHLSESTIEPTIERFQQSGSMEEKFSHSCRSQENIDFVRARVKEPKMTLVDVPRVGLSETTT